MGDIVENRHSSAGENASCVTVALSRKPSFQDEHFYPFSDRPEDKGAINTYPAQPAGCLWLLLCSVSRQISAPAARRIFYFFGGSILFEDPKMW